MDAGREFLAQIKRELHVNTVAEVEREIADISYIPLLGAEVQVVALSDEVLDDEKLWLKTCVALQQIDAASSNILGSITCTSSKIAQAEKSSSRQDRYKKWPCGVCHKGVGTNSILCETCQQWIHKRCTGIRSRLDKVGNFRCPNCIAAGASCHGNRVNADTDRERHTTSEDAIPVAEKPDVEKADTTNDVPAPRTPVIDTKLKQFDRLNTNRLRTCSLCNIKFHGTFLLRRHLARKHHLFLCQICPSTFSDPIELESHEAIHIDGKGLRCKYCSLVFPRTHELGAHVRFRHRDRKRSEC